MPVQADYTVIHHTTNMVWLIDHDGRKSITNDAEAVVAEIVANHGNKRIIYQDTQGEWDELIHEHGVFKRFAPAGQLRPH